MIFSFKYLIKILVGDCFNKGVLELSHGDSRARASSPYLALVGVKLGESRLDQVNLETEFYKNASVCLVKILFRSIVKIR